jgi:hypothetical protein
MIVCVADVSSWVERLSQVLLLQPFRRLDGDPWGFDNAEFAIGSGFLAIVAPADGDSRLSHFLDRYGETPYAISLSVGDLATTMEDLASSGVASHASTRDGMFHFGWIHPTGSGSPLYQLTERIDRGSGYNANLSGINRATILVDDLDASVRFHQLALGITATRPTFDELYDCEATDLIVGGSGPDAIRLLARSALHRQVRESHPPILGFTVTVRDLDKEVARLADIGIAVRTDGHQGSRRAIIDPSAMHELHLELEQLL